MPLLWKLELLELPTVCSRVRPACLNRKLDGVGSRLESVQVSSASSLRSLLDGVVSASQDLPQLLGRWVSSSCRRLC